METIKIKKPLLMQTKSAEIIGSNDHLLTEILLSLPIYSLVDFKLVSKQWHSIITNPTFCHIRRCRKSIPPAIGLFSHSMDFDFNKSFDFVPFYVPRFRAISSPIQKHWLTRDHSSSDIRIVQSCNGLLLCQDIKDYHKYYVCNPTTKHSFRIPQLDETVIKGMGLAFDPTKSTHYHVVCVHVCPKNRDNLLLRIQIYSSETGSWRICGDPFLSQPKYDHPVYWNGSIHWMSILPLEFSYFNIDRQELDKMKRPPITVGGWRRPYYYFGESCDHLHFISARRSRFDVYEMERDYSEWFVKYKVDLGCVGGCYPKIIDESNVKYFFGNVLYLVRDDKEPFLVLQILKQVVRYNLVSMTFRVLHEFRTGERIPNIGFQYIESLSCV